MTNYIYLLQLIAVAVIVYKCESVGIQDVEFNFPEEANVLGQNLFQKKEVSKFTKAQRQAIVDLHNHYRTSVQPPASNMNLMVNIQ